MKKIKNQKSKVKIYDFAISKYPFSRIRKKGFALATVLVLLGVVLIGSASLLTISRIEARISRSQKESVQSYYVAEAGIQNAIWKIEHDQALLDALDAGTLSTTFTYQNRILNLRDISVSINSIEPGRAEIISTGLVREDRFPAQRVVKVEIFRGPPNMASVLGNNVVYGNGLVEFISSGLNLLTGDIYSGSDQRYYYSDIQAPTSILGSVGEYLNVNSTVNTMELRAENVPPAITYLPQPGLDFLQLRNQANVVYAPSQFENIVKEGGVIDFPGPITFINGALVLGPEDLKAEVTSVTIRVHGLFVVNGASASITTSGLGKTINLEIVDDTNGPSGLVTRTNMTISGSGNIHIDGVLNASNHFTFQNTNNVYIDGGIVVGWLEFNNAQATILIGNTQRIGELFGFIITPSIIEITHWEEEY